MLRELDNIAPAEAGWEGCPSHLPGADTRCLSLDILSLQVSCQSVNPRDPPMMAQEQEKPRCCRWGWGNGETATKPGRDNSRQPTGESQQLPLAWCPCCQRVMMNGDQGKEKANKGIPNLDAASFPPSLADH